MLQQHQRLVAFLSVPVLPMWDAVHVEDVTVTCDDLMILQRVACGLDKICTGENRTLQREN
jgi:hypothetical protein